tara:strand:- start:234 stop:836 length:603 start_codon:yes stop_codon:yes gene_type:complete
MKMHRTTRRALEAVYGRERKDRGRDLRKARRIPWTPFDFSLPARDDDTYVNPGERYVGLWSNSRYTVMEYTVEADERCPFPSVTWLSIKRNDRGVVVEWRDLQRIKNEICGAEREAVQMFPVESRLVDTANQYHLWVLPAGLTFPFGMRGRVVSEGLSEGVVQEPWPDDCRPDDLRTPEDVTHHTPDGCPVLRSPKEETR